MNGPHVGIRNRNFRRKESSIFLVSDGADLHYNRSRLDVFLPRYAMPSNRPNLTLDQQFLQELLSAAYTIQQHNDRFDHSETLELEPEAPPPPPEPDSTCPQCGAAKASDDVPCEHCSPEDLRPGERMQRKWASMWLMSQQQGLWPDRPSEELDTGNEGEPFQVKHKPRATTLDLAASGIIAAPFENELVKEKIASEKSETIPAHENHGLHDHGPQNGRQNGDRRNGNSITDHANGKSVLGKSVIEKQVPESNWTLDANDEEADDEDDSKDWLNLDTQDPASAVPTFHTSASYDTSAVEESPTYAHSTDANSNSTDLAPEDHEPRTISLLQRIADWRLRLRFHRADLYLGVSVLVAALALLWPTAGSTQQPTLSSWERALVVLGIAEAAPPAVHLQGDPAIEVWIDPHSALYYCPGEEQYGKTADGRFTTQREAQVDRFEPASRSACE